MNAATAAKDLNWLRLQLGDLKCEIIPRRDLAIIAVQGPKARSRVEQALPQLKLDAIASFHAAEIGQFFIARTGYTGEDGFEILLPGVEAVPLWKSLRAQGIALAGLGARDTLRLEAGMNLYGQDMDETTSPLESGLTSAVDIRPGRNFIGKMAIASKSISNKMLGLVLRDRGILRAGQKVITARGSGTVTSGGFSPTMNASIALARVPVDVAAREAVKVEVREKMLRAETVTYPFVRNGQILIENVNI